MENKENTNEEVVIEKSEMEESIEAISKEVAAYEAQEDADNQILEESEEVTEEITDETEEVAEEATDETMEEAPEETTDESSVDDAQEATPAKKSKVWLYVLIAVGAFVMILAAVYLAVAHHYSDKFLMGTTVNGIDCAGMTVDEVRAMLQKQVEEYSLTIETTNNCDVTIKGTEIGIKYNGVSVLEDAMKEQNPYLWIGALYQKQNVKAKVDFDYDAAKLDEVIGSTEFMKAENQKAPVSAIPVYKDGKYDIQAEEYGTAINQEMIYATARKAVDTMDTTMNLTEDNCYVQPAFKKDSKQVIDAKDTLNKWLEASVTYKLDGIEVVVNQTIFVNWFVIDPATMAVDIDATQARTFTDTLGSKYNTPNKTGQVTTPTGKVASVPNAQLGRVVGAAAECDQLMNEIKAGETKVREPLLSQVATPEGEVSWGTTYIEVDLTEQHMWYIANGAVAFECDVVTGSPGRSTPAGSFTILEKLRNKVLRGYRPNGTLEYATPVKYWARVTWSGIGFHDATWQPGFGGELYRQGYGSHGCINMSLNDVAAFYEMIQVGCPVLIHY